ncbi:hypothetical protein Tco_0407075 [Tanacetum coccineum]
MVSLLSLLAPLRKLIDNFKILQSCNGLLLCIGSGRPVFYYVYNPSTNHFKKLSYPDYSLDNSYYYRSGLDEEMAFDPPNHRTYKLVDMLDSNHLVILYIEDLLLKTGMYEPYDIGSSEFTIYEMMIGFSVWTVRYHVDTNDFMTLLSEVSKTLHEICDCGSNQLDDNYDDDELLQQFEAEHNVYEFIPSFSSV